MKRVTAMTFLVLMVGLLVLSGCAEERTLISKRHVVEGLDRSSGGGHETAVRREKPERPKYREHWWQFWRKPLPKGEAIRREEVARDRYRRGRYQLNSTGKPAAGGRCG